MSLSVVFLFDSGFVLHEMMAVWECFFLVGCLLSHGETLEACPHLLRDCTLSTAFHAVCVLWVWDGKEDASILALHVTG